jgi:hypothetical protein
VLAELGLDRYPELWGDYFGHYRRLIWLAQEPDGSSQALAAQADRVASMFGLPLTRIETGVSRLEAALAALVADADCTFSPSTSSSRPGSGVGRPWSAPVLANDYWRDDHD